jgi:hypothetical protein
MRRRFWLTAGITRGDRMKAFTPPITVGSIVTPSFSRMPFCIAALSLASRPTRSFHSSALLGSEFQVSFV